MGIFGKIFRRKKGSSDDKSSISGSSKKSNNKKGSSKQKQQQLEQKNKLNTSSPAVLQDSAVNAAGGLNSDNGRRRSSHEVAKPQRESATVGGDHHRKVTSSVSSPSAAGGHNIAGASTRPFASSLRRHPSDEGGASTRIHPSQQSSSPSNGYPASSPHNNGWGSPEQAVSPQMSPRDENINYVTNITADTSSNMSSSIDDKNAPDHARLSTQHLQTWDQQPQQKEIRAIPPPPAAAHIYRMNIGGDIPKQQMFAMDDMDRSDASGSSFNLSTDAEDSEYESLRKRGTIRPLNGTLDSSVVSGTTYTTDDDRIFPGLQTDDEMTQSTAQSSAKDNPPRILPVAPLSMASMLGQGELSDNTPTPTSVEHKIKNRTHPGNHLSLDIDNNNNNNARPVQESPAKMSYETEEDFRAWTISPTSTSASNTPRNMPLSTRSAPATSTPNSAVSPSRPPEQPPSPAAKFFAPVSRNTPNGPIRNFTSPKSQASSEFSFEEDFADFADFGGTTFGQKQQAQLQQQHMQQQQQYVQQQQAQQQQQQVNNGRSEPTYSKYRQNGHHGDMDNHSEHKTDAHDSILRHTEDVANQSDELIFMNNEGSHVSSSQVDTSLSELLAQAKNKSRTRSSRKGKTSSASVSSAPAITSSYLRQHHGLRPHHPGGTPGTSSVANHSVSPRNNDRNSGDTTSVSDIISSLEATNQSRLRNAPSGYRPSSHHSMGDTGAASMARSVKERLREKRRREREYGTGASSVGGNGSRLHKSPDVSSSENSENDQDDQDWLFDGVTGALGPRGIAADLESLSGRSKNSTGNRSHKSHRSHRSHKSRSRPRSTRHNNHHRASSGDSVDSRGSRQSRSSRYSHRSTKSYISQMSEQSRSVANDLLRLEMQLAMVGSSNAAASTPGSGDEGGRASSSLPGSRMSAHHHNKHHHHRPSHSSRKPRSSTSSVTSNSMTASSSTARRMKVMVLAPPGKLGIILANKADSKGTVVSGVRTSSVLAAKISPGDRIIAIDGEDVSRMTVSEITTIMARKSDFERTLSVLTVPKNASAATTTTTLGSSSALPTAPSSSNNYDSYSQYRR